MSAALRLEDVGCVRGGRALFAGVSLALAAGDAAVVTGPNGIGKSSLIRIAAGLLAPDAGRVVRQGDVALMAEAGAMDGERTLRSALAWWAAIDGCGDAVAGAIDAVGLTPVADVPVRWLSTGQRKRAALARVIAGGAGVWLLDEPANGLDAASVAVLAGAIARHRAAGGVALVATHLPLDLAHAQAIAL